MRPIAPDTTESNAAPAIPARAEAPELDPDEDEDPDDDEDAAADAVLAGGAVAMAPTPPVTGPLSLSCKATSVDFRLNERRERTVFSLLPMAFAAAWKAWNVFPEEGALIEPTIPKPQ